MENFKEAIIQIARSNPNLFPNDASTSLIEQRFSQFFSDSKTPNHPPYAAMIYRAISELNEKGGSSEKSISTYIKKEYEQLPWAHSTMLKHHLQQLCDRNEIHVTHKQCYSLGAADLESDKKKSGSCMKSKEGIEFPAAPCSTELRDPVSSQQDKGPKKSKLKDKPTCKCHGTHQQPSEPEKDEVLCVCKSAAVSGKRQKAVKKGKFGSKKGQPIKVKVKSLAECGK